MTNDNANDSARAPGEPAGDVGLGLVPCSWKAELKVDGEWCSSGLRFATKTGAEIHAEEKYQAWLLTTGRRATACTDPVSIGSGTVERCDSFERPSDGLDPNATERGPKRAYPGEVKA